MSNPQAYLAVQKSRLKQYGSNYYLQNGTEFQIELFNPTQSNIAAAISINGVKQDFRFILKPGMRFFLDRFMNVDKKFLFETYNVESGNAEVEKAIAQNGKVEISFYKEKPMPRAIPKGPILRSNFDTDYYKHRINLSGNLTNDNNIVGNFFSSSSITNMPPVNSTFTSTFGDAAKFSSEVTMDSMFDARGVDFMDMANTPPPEKETGRVEAGSKSDQVFETVNMDFEYLPMTTVSFQILPLSQKPVEEGEVAMYCSLCGRRAKKGENFCPKCGNNLVEQKKNLD